MTYANVSNVADELGRPITTVEEIGQVSAWLRRAEAAIRVRLPNLTALVDAGSLDAQTVADIEAAAVARKAMNPEGKQNERIDDYSYGLVDAAATVDIFITDAEWDQLIPRRRSGAFTIRPA